MSDEQSISVAELLARNGGAQPPAGGRRRRHRGGENSITVAELTGEIPVVRDGEGEQPAQSSADAAQPAQSEAATRPDATQAAQAEAAAQPQAPEESAPQSPFAPPAPRNRVAEPPVTPADTTDTFDAVPDGTEQPEEEAASSASLAQAVADTGRFQAIDPGNVDEYPISQGPADAPHVDEPVTEAVEAEVVETVHTTEGRDEVSHAWSQWSDGAAPGMATADFNTAQVRERQARLAEEAQVADAPEPAVVPVPDTASMSVQQISDAHDTEAPSTDTPTEVAFDEAADADQAPRGARSWLLLIAEVFGGVVAGAALFYGFYQLWNWGGGTWTIALTVVLAFVVIIAIVTFTHYLRKTTDYLTLGLALFVGLVITFGPLLMSLASQN
ncbi:Transmembrane protein OS=Tsukamurella paurometabola (strain ATCC 8368 / DSM / CCUG 35730 / CIP 100753 / JCM 10117 / KCTC 9821 / NBRC 16120 / NCIMB 702349/ NCTC 13040) OX=521096 GN=Tpau_0657 PE=4 SV=1 [Tsukamurella paurometabola]|uniref:Transmembrane protein n=1 Tax=Tsukamurella paurometabola (strain ATCC 8368 / DSM 20162 / CCUG 35730 / CIP 100753 / JCM 10117 / KCTC 9821 / NBRC 16120 / NCIMB 702349 / NCTC 13040) TaxID=521096 RepID=D5UT07_TSUPD|nr:MFS transporter [Tsukamurella paurometabola]ADG77294.1 hypothetical protein Tpau_0657 [Tsukamurella paurometabola DSM 20162]SUP43411.1 Uncharacterised protein [Tsukamurella paurometabola]